MTRSSRGTMTEFPFSMREQMKPDKIMKVGPQNLVIDEYGDFWYYVCDDADRTVPRHKFIYIPTKHTGHPMVIYVPYNSKTSGNFKSMSEVLINYGE